jgi:hypothetical protein
VEEIMAGWRKSHNEDLKNVCSSKCVVIREYEIYGESDIHGT